MPEPDFGVPYAETDYSAKVAEGDGELWTAGRTHDLEEAVVEGKASRDIMLRDRFIKRSHFHFDMQRETDKYVDSGRDVPKLEEWILDQPIFADLFYNKHRAIGYVGWGSMYGIGRYKALFTLEGFPEMDYITTGGYLAGMRSPYRGYVCVKYGGDRCGIPAHKNSVQGWKLGPEACIDDIGDIFDMYISIEDNVTEYMFDYERNYLMKYNPFHVYVDDCVGYCGRPKKRSKSWRSTIFQGYNIPHTFHTNDYSQMPPEPDYRRTLYWNPDVQLDDNGEATVEFYNNSTCKSISVSAEGVNDEGLPIILKQHE